MPRLPRAGVADASTRTRGTCRIETRSPGPVAEPPWTAAALLPLWDRAALLPGIRRRSLGARRSRAARPCRGGASAAAAAAMRPAGLASGKRQQGCRSRAPSSSTTPPGGIPGTTETMKKVDNSSATASPRGGVESSVMRTQSTATQVNTIRRWPRTSLRLSGEVEPSAGADGEARVPRHGGACAASDVVGGSRLGRGGACEDGRPAGAGRWRQRPAGVRAAVGARKRGNARGAKGGRKANGGGK